MNPWQFAHLTKSDGLASDIVVDMVQDSAGFWWLATKSGLQRFDGKHFTTFTHNPDDPGSLPADFVNALWIDERQRLWVATSLGVCRYDPASGNFISVSGDTGRLWTFYPSLFFSDSTGGFWLATTTPGGLYRFAPTEAVWKRVAGMTNTAIIAYIVAEPVSGNFWFTYRHGLGLLERATGKVWLSGENPEKHPLLSQITHPTSIYLDSQKKLWIAHRPSGSNVFQLITYNTQTGAVARVNHSFQSARIVFREDARGRLWFFSDDCAEFGYFDLQNGDKHLFKYVP
ncbi:MAG: ligand-binding sensor domain-containing protein, partial [Saprospiraceae bacterium]